MSRAKPAIPIAVEFFDALPDAALVDVNTVAAVHGVSPSTIWSRVAKNRFTPPEPKDPGTNATRWLVGKLRRERAERQAPQRSPSSDSTVIVVKTNGTQVVFGTYSDHVEAERVANQLRAIGCLVGVERAQRDDVPGRQRS